MPNPKHLEILNKGVEVWNKWREDNPDVRPDLIQADLKGANLEEANLERAHLKEAHLEGANLEWANLGWANLEAAHLKEAHLEGADLEGAHLEWANLEGARLSVADLRGANLTGAHLKGASLERVQLQRADLQATNLEGVNLEWADLGVARLSRANLVEADLSRTNLQEADLISGNLTNANITGATLYGTARDNWIIDGIKCDYIYFDKEGKKRTPKDRDFKPGEFEELYRSLPTVEYYFEDGFSPIDAVIMDRVVQEINARNPEFEIKLDSFHSRGQPHAKFTVLHKEIADQALQQIAAEYDTKIKVLKGQKDELMKVISILSNRPSVIAGTIHSLEQHHGDKTDIRAGGDVSYAKDQAGASIVKGNPGSVPGDDNGLKE
jgi:uncharacterized protein YjbI with pentapeptide repeats